MSINNVGVLTLLFFGVQLSDFDLQTIHSFPQRIYSEGECSSLYKQLPEHILRILAYKHVDPHTRLSFAYIEVFISHTQYKYIFINLNLIKMQTKLQSSHKHANTQMWHTFARCYEPLTHSKHSLRLPSWRMMLAKLILVTHSSSLRMLVGMVWRHTCRGSIFLVTRGMVGCGG